VLCPSGTRACQKKRIVLLGLGSLALGFVAGAPPIDNF